MPEAPPSTSGSGRARGARSHRRVRVVGLTLTLALAAGMGVWQSRERDPVFPCSLEPLELAGVRYLQAQFLDCDPEAELPLLLSLHGMADRPQLPFGEMQRPVRVVMPRAPRPYQGGWSWFPFHASAVDGQALGRAIDAQRLELAGWLQALKLRHPTSRLVVTGVSQGGMLSLALALGNPALVDHAVPIAGMLPDDLRTQLLEAHPRRPHPPIEALHGALDARIPLQAAERTLEGLANPQENRLLRVFAGAGHAMTDPMHARRYTLIHRALPKASLWLW